MPYYYPMPFSIMSNVRYTQAFHSFNVRFAITNNMSVHLFNCAIIQSMQLKLILDICLYFIEEFESHFIYELTVLIASMISRINMTCH